MEKYQCDKSRINLQWNDMISFHCRLISSFHAWTTFLDNFGHSCFPKRFCMHRSCLTLHYRRIRVVSSNWCHTLTSLYSSRNVNLHATSVQRQLQAAFLNCKIILIPSFKRHFKAFFIPNKRTEPSRINEKWLGNKLVSMRFVFR